MRRKTRRNRIWKALFLYRVLYLLLSAGPIVTGLVTGIALLQITGLVFIAMALPSSLNYPIPPTPPINAVFSKKITEAFYGKGILEGLEIAANIGSL